MFKVSQITLALIFIISGTLFAQNAYYDALVIMKMRKASSISKQQMSELLRLLANYNLDTTRTADKSFNFGQSINKSSPQNPFFDDLKNLIINEDKLSKSIEVFHQGTPPKDEPINAPNISNAVQGLADFLIKQGKKELDIAFFNRMRTYINNHVECQIMFPQTMEFLNKTAPYDYAELLRTLKAAFKADIDNLVINLNNLMNTHEYQQYLRKYPGIKLAIRSALVIRELTQGDVSVAPDEIISRLSQIKELADLNLNLGHSFSLLHLFSKSILTDAHERETTGNLWIPVSELNKNIFQDQLTLKIFLGLVYQNADKIEFKTTISNAVSFRKYMSDNHHDLNLLGDLFQNFSLLAAEVDKSLNVFKDAKDANSASASAAEYLEKTLYLLDYGSKIAKMIQPEINADPYLAIAHDSQRLYKNIISKDYNDAVFYTYLILERVFNQSPAIVKEEALRTGLNDAKLNKNLEEQKKYNLPKTSTVSTIFKYGNFMASLITAETPADAEKAIESAVLPAGSSSIKKNTMWNIALNAYIGYYSGKRLEVPTQDSWHNNRGITAPIGITFSKSLGKIERFNLGSLSLFTTLLNVGSIVDYRLNNDKTAVTQEIKWANIFSPGGYIVYGLFGSLPLSIGYGYQYGPRPFKVSQDDGILSDKPGWRSNFFFTIDIPLANFWSVNKNK